MDDRKSYFQNTERLYHYTSFRNVFLILDSQDLLWGKQSAMNDINESWRAIYSVYNGIDADGTFQAIDEAKKELQLYRQLSFSEDGAYPGFAITSMWGNYADRGNGVCIVFDKQKILSKFANSENTQWSRIEYISDYDNSITIDSNLTIRENIERNFKNIFFTKSSDWSHEQEFRIVDRCMDISSMVDISGCIMAVIVFNANDITTNDDSIWNSPSVRRLKEVAGKYDIPVLELTIKSIENNGITLNDRHGQWFPKRPKYDLDI